MGNIATEPFHVTAVVFYVKVDFFVSPPVANIEFVFLCHHVVS